MCINIAFLEQDNKNHGAQGRRMMYSLMPLTKEEMDATFDLVNGCFTARENLRFLYHSNMDLGYIVKELNKDFCHMKRTFIISETNSSITFKKEKIDFVITYGLNNNYLIMDNITIDKNGLHIMIKENNFNQEYLTNWFHSYFSDIGIKEGGDKYCFKWGKATLVDGFVDVCFNPKWDEKMLYKKVKQLKK